MLQRLWLCNAVTILSFPVSNLTLQHIFKEQASSVFDEELFITEWFLIFGLILYSGNDSAQKDVLSLSELHHAEHSN